MAPVQGRPFLACLLDDLVRQNIRRVVISTCHMAEVIEDYFGTQYRSLQIAYAREMEPLGTGGAIRLSMQQIRGHRCVVLNGDTFFDVNLAAMEQSHIDSGALLTIALKPVDDLSRYGSVTLDGTRVVGFCEKEGSIQAGGLINGGIYLANSGLLQGLELPAGFSFEHDYLATQCDRLPIHGFVSDGFFIDIGVPSDYQRAQSEVRLRPAPL